MNETDTQNQQRDFAADMEAFKAAFPEVEQLPDPVAEQWAQGNDLTESYLAHQRQKEEAQAVLRQNAQAAAHAPVRGSSGGAQSPKGSDSFLQGLESEGW